MIPRNDFEKEVHRRLEKLEKESFGATAEENYTPRQTAKAISEGDTQNHFNGERTLESAKGRVTSFYQNYDKGSVSSLYGDELTQYHKEEATVRMLITKYHLESFARELNK